MMAMNRPSESTTKRHTMPASVRQATKEPRVPEQSVHVRRRENQVRNTATEIKSYWTNREIVQWIVHNPNGYVHQLILEGTDRKMYQANQLHNAATDLLCMKKITKTETKGLIGKFATMMQTTEEAS